MRLVLLGKLTSPLSTWAADRGVATQIAVSDVVDLVGQAGADDGADASVIPPSPILGILSGVWEATPSAPELPMSLGRSPTRRNPRGREGWS